MNAKLFVEALSKIHLQEVFNPYRDHCGIHDLVDGPKVRRRNLTSYLEAVEKLKTDTIWMGRDLGYRGGRRTGLALTDEQRLSLFAQLYPGALPQKATKGPVIAERTATEIWNILTRLAQPPLLWNVFPFHPHEPGNPLTNRRFTSRELAMVSELNHSLISWLDIKRIICIGQDAAAYAKSLGLEVDCVRHPSYGGIADFRMGMRKVYGHDLQEGIGSQLSLLACHS
ncbi:uracil-DNA glycosylase [Methylobacillus caricis]|uniref:uracil-DNA glycosylase n=1 Tax=Methylobacillus caricis TaxID=1971611 RepID=UPI001D000728|nr:uracil-DNA glycosylase [Methylobacillus caricis]MCB5188873.1 uracil-DNA glycosylase [Methylobacillus caricis]